MKLKASKLLILTLVAFCLFGAASRAQAWSWWDDPGPLVFVQPRVLIGYMLPTRTNALNINMLEDQKSRSIKSLQQSAKMEGLWTELVVPVKSAFPIGFTPSVGYLIPADYRVDETYLGNTGQIAERTWKTKTTLYNLKFSIDYAFSQSFTTMLGFQYDSLMTNYTAPVTEVPNTNVATFNRAQRVGMEVSLGIPFVGVMYERNIGSIFDLKAYITAYPGLPGVLSFQESVQHQVNGAKSWTVKFSQEISSGYYYEAFAQLSIPVWRGIGGGAFLKYSEFSGKIIGVSIDHKDTPGTDSMSADVTYLRNSFVIGASITALF